MKKFVLAIALVSILAPSLVQAGTNYALIGAKTKHTTEAYAGLNWTLESGAMPSLILGVFDTEVTNKRDTSGANLSVHLNLVSGFSFSKLKLSYISGKNDMQGELGIGYDFLKAAPLLSLGANAANISAGIDAYTNPSFNPYVNLHSQGTFDAPNLKCVAAPVTTFFMDPTCGGAI